MAFLLNSVDLSTYGIIPGHAPGSNIALSGCFDMPKRTGKLFHSWGDEDSIEPFVDADELFFEGRDILLYGSILGSRLVIDSYLYSFQNAIKAFTGLVTLSTPYGDFSVQVKNISTESVPGGSRIIITFREPVVVMNLGTNDVTQSNPYTIDGIPFSSYGLYVSKPEAFQNLPELKEQFFTQYGSDGYQVVKRDHNMLEINGFIDGGPLNIFLYYINELYTKLSSEGLRSIILNDEIRAKCFAAEGFKIDKVRVINGQVYANFKISLTCTWVRFGNWYMPSADEQQRMKNELFAYGVGGFAASGVYATSTEYSATQIYGLNYATGSFNAKLKSGAAMFTRPCRLFTSRTQLSLRDAGPFGGLIFYATDNGDGTFLHAEAYRDDLPSGTAWSNINNVLIGGTTSTVGAGINNTTRIIAQPGHLVSLAKLCDDLIL